MDTSDYTGIPVHEEDCMTVTTTTTETPYRDELLQEETEAVRTGWHTPVKVSLPPIPISKIPVFARNNLPKKIRKD